MMTNLSSSSIVRSARNAAITRYCSNMRIKPNEAPPYPALIQTIGWTIWTYLQQQWGESEVLQNGPESGKSKKHAYIGPWPIFRIVPLNVTHWKFNL